MRSRLEVALYSLVMPGLGQLRQHRLLIAGAWFVLGIATLAISPGIFPLICLLSGIETYRVNQLPPPVEVGKYALYSLCLISGFAAWTMIVFPSYFSLPVREKSSARQIDCLPAPGVPADAQDACFAK